MRREARLDYFRVPQFERIPFLVHGFGTRYWTVKDIDRDERLKTFKRISLHQIHSDSIHFIEKYPQEALQGDALVTNVPGFLLMVKAADCLPVLIADKEQKVVAAVHCGWRSTSRRLAQKVVRSLEMRFGASPSRLFIAMGPSIKGSCYEVGEELPRIFAREGTSGESFRESPVHSGKYLLDLREANRDQLIQAGVIEKNIFSVDRCTHCDIDLISFRRDRGSSDRMLSFVGISF